MLPIRSPLGAIGAILVALEGVAAGALFALRSNPILQGWLVAAMIFVLVLVTLAILGVVVYFAICKPAYLFNPSDISERAHVTLYGGGTRPIAYVSIANEPGEVIIPQPATFESEQNEPFSQ